MLNPDIQIPRIRMIKGNSMKKILFAICLVSLVTFFANAQEKIDIDTDFVADSNRTSYEEWTGGYSPEEINTASEIMDIGRRLGRGIKYQESVQNDPNPFNKGNPAYKYSAARVYGSEKRGADVILIGHTATVDTVKCLKLIIRGYLESAFAYNAEDSKRLAEKICYWNTNNFDNRAYFDSNFESAVLSVFDGRFEHVGLSSSYKEWKGTVLVIPHVSDFVPSVNAGPDVSEEVIEQSESDDSDYSSSESELAESDSYDSYGNSYGGNSYNSADSSSKNYDSSSLYAGKKSSSWLTTPMLVLIIAAAAVLIGVIIAVILMTRRQ